MQIAILALAVTSGIGCGAGGGSRESAPLRSDVVVAPIDLYGETSRVGGTTGKTVILRDDAAGLAVTDFAGSGIGPSTYGPRLSFSSPSVAWAATYSTADAAHLLLRSDDGARSWSVVDTIPLPSEGARILDVHVDSTTTGVLTAWVAISFGFEFASRPSVLTRRLDQESPWTELPGLDPLGCTRLAIFAPRGGLLELLRLNSVCLFGGAGVDAIYPISASGAGAAEPIPASFIPADYATAGDRGWIAGGRGDLTTPLAAQVPAIAVGARGQAFAVVDVPGVASGGAVTTIDFLDGERGFACGSESSSRSFCLATEDGGRSWVRGRLDLPDQTAGIAGVVRASGGRGLASFGANVVGFLETSDGGASWTEVALPPLATTWRIGPLSRSPSAPDPAEGDLVEDVHPMEQTAARALDRHDAVLARTTTGSDRAASSTPGAARVWAVGDSSARGPNITGVALRSDDGGVSWSEALSAPGGSFSGLAFVDAATGWIVGANRIFRTGDGESSFVDQTAGIVFPGRITSVRLASAADDQRAVVVARTISDAYSGEEAETVLHTADGGASWTPSQVDSGAQSGDETYVEGGLCLTKGGAGVMVVYVHVLLTRDGGATWEKGPPFDYAFSDGGSSISGDGFNAPTVACSGDSDLWILVGPRDPRTSDPKTQSLWHSPDGGGTWEDLSERVARRSSFLPLTGAFNAAGSGWLVAADAPAPAAALLRSIDRGQRWTELASPLMPGASAGYPTLEFPEAMAFASESEGVMLTTTFESPVARSHSVLSTNDGGDTWKRGILPADFHPLGVSYLR